MAVEVRDASGLAEMLDPESRNPVPVHRAEPGKRGRVAVDHGDQEAVARQRFQQRLDRALAGAAVDARGLRRLPSECS